MTKLTQPSEFQKRISGEWHGLPSTFDAEGNHLGYDKVYRESAFDPATGATRYTMHTNFHGMSSVDFHRLNTPDGFDFSVRDSDQDRIYLGPDFYGSGQPYGGVVDSQYYSPFWAAELNTLNWVLDDGQTQVYSSLLYEGPALKYVFNGIYKVAFDYHTNPKTKATIDAWCDKEKNDGAKPHVLSSKRAGTWQGQMHIYRATDQANMGNANVRITYKPTSLLTAEQTVEIDAPAETRLSRKYTMNRARHSNRHTFHGPDAYGNGIAYGRALYIVQNFPGEAVKVKGREFMIDNDYTLATVWQFHRGNKPEYFVFGVLNWQVSS